jgi:glycosyltransferase involved in cell wall biosynthesis
MPVPLVSVVIPTRNRAHAVDRCLDALAAQTLARGSVEVIVVDDGSEPALTLDASRWEAFFPITLIRQRNTGPAGARNRGVAAARGECLAFTDDDCLPTTTWLETLTAALRDHPEALVGGSTVNGITGDIFAETSQLIVDLVYEYFNRDPASAYFFASNNIAVRREGFLAVGGFDEDFVPASEDREFCDRWRMMGRPLVWEQRALIEHRHSQSLLEFMRLHWRYGQGAFLYHAKRKRRGSGTMSSDFGFHCSLPRAVLRKFFCGSRKRRWLVALNLGLWQLTNAGGFLYGFLESHRNRRRADRGRVNGP